MAKGGKDLLLKVNTTGSTYVTVGGLRSKSMTINNETIDVTNHGSNQYREILDGAGIRSLTVSGSGVHTGDAATLNKIDDNCLSGTLTNFQIVDADGSGRTYQASFKITSFARAGEYNAEQTFEISLESSGSVTVS
jgi:TP901-1 family phage major tail protein